MTLPVPVPVPAVDPVVVVRRTPAGIALLMALLLGPVAVLVSSGCDHDSLPGGQFDAGGGGPLGFGCDTTADCALTDGSTLECCLGRCTDTSIDPRHCGGCNLGCAAIPNTTSISCTAGTCRIAVCDPGFANCDGTAATGCEIDLATDNANCGHCGGACGPGPHSMASCNAARCRVTCDVRFADCNRIVGDGCEVDLSASVSHCGACFRVCPSPTNASAGCAAGRCGIGACAVSFGDCNQDAADGCESQLATDKNHCGACGNACPVNQLCVAGGCRGGLYAPVGPQTNVPEASLVGWASCFVDPYSGAGASTAQIQAMCPKAKLMLACRKVGASQLTSLAWAARADVLFDTGGAICMGPILPHQANGTGFYFNGAVAWGFANGGETVTLCNCDTTNISADQRMCWHANGGLLFGGYRCGATLGLNNDATWERVVFQAD